MRLVALLICSLQATATEPPFAPVATCINGVCTMSEKDYKAFQKFHAALVESQLVHEKRTSDLEELTSEMAKKLVRESYCQARRT